MAALASDWLRHFWLLLWNRWTACNETWQEERSQCRLPSLCFWADRKNKMAPPANPSKRWHIVLRCTICGPLGLLLTWSNLLPKFVESLHLKRAHGQKLTCFKRVKNFVSIFMVKFYIFVLIRACWSYSRASFIGWVCRMAEGVQDYVKLTCATVCVHRASSFHGYSHVISGMQSLLWLVKDKFPITAARGIHIFKCWNNEIFYTNVNQSFLGGVRL